MQPAEALFEQSSVFQSLLRESAERHAHLCPRQVLGVRLGLRGLRALGLVPENYGRRYWNRDKRLLTILETDGCGADGVAVATACTVGRRTLRVEDYGKMAATMVDTKTGRCVRVAPRPEARVLAIRAVPDAASAWHAYLVGYQRLSDEALVSVTAVTLRQTIAAIISQPGRRAICAACGEEIMNERELLRADRVLCRGCAGAAYYQALEQ